MAGEAVMGARTTEAMRVERAETLFEVFVEMAFAGARAPTSEELLDAGHVDAPGSTRRLIDQRRIKAEVYSPNWRVIEIKDGEHAGERTRECPRVGPPYKVLYGPAERKPMKRLGVPGGTDHRH